MVNHSQPTKGIPAPLPETSRVNLYNTVLEGESTAPCGNSVKKKLKSLDSPLFGVNIMFSSDHPKCGDFYPYTNIKVREAYNLYRAARTNFISNLCDQSYSLMVEAARNIYDLSQGKVIVSVPNYECSGTTPITR